MSDSSLPPSFVLAGEGLWQLGGEDLANVAKTYSDDLARVAPRLRDGFARERSYFRTVVGEVLERYNSSLQRRIRGYVALGQALHWEYPWPVVAILGLQQVRRGLGQQAGFSLVGQVMGRRGDSLQRVADTFSDILRRTNRGIFNDSVPAVILALRGHELRSMGEQALAEALVHGPRPLAMDAVAQSLAARLYAALAIRDGHQRFAALADLTLRHFEREQAVFTHHLGPEPTSGPPKPSVWMTFVRTQQRRLPAPCIVDGRLVFRPYRLPPDFDIRDHEVRVREFGHAFVRSVTQDPEAYKIAARYVAQLLGQCTPTWTVTTDAAPTPDWLALGVQWPT